MVNELFINKKVWNEFTESEMEVYQEKVFNYYRGEGFPYFTTNPDYRLKEFNKLNNYDRGTMLIDGNTIKQTMHGLALAWSYMSHAFKVRCNDKLAPYEVFMDDDMLKKTIKKRIRMGDNMSDNGLRKMMKMISGAQCVSNFRPTASATLYDYFMPNGGVTWDMSSGYGGRLLGAIIAGVDYIGTDPAKETFKGLEGIANDFGGDINIELHNVGSEVYKPTPESIDFCFTSPPYFDLERYADEDTQSYRRFPNKELWIDGFIRKTFESCYIGLKEEGKMAINIANTKYFPNLEEKIITVATETGFILADVWKLALSNPQMKNNKSPFKYEPIFIFDKLM